MPIPATIEQPTREKYRIALEPAQNALASMVLVTKQEEMPGISPWVAQTRSAMTLEEIERHRLAIIGFYYAILPEAGLASFPDYLTKLDNMDPVQLVDKLLDAYLEFNLRNNPEKKKEDIHWEQALSSAEEYVRFLSEGFEDDLIDVEIETKAYEYVSNPPALKVFLTQHLRWFWDEHLAEEWARAEPILLETLKAFQAVNLKNKSDLEIARYITGQDLDETSWQECLESNGVVTYIPNPHVGPYAHKNTCFDPPSIVFGARQPEDADVRIPELDRADIVARMSALADDTRLRILQMISERGELRSQDIKEETELSQPSVSRYLTQLTATGYLRERRVNGAKAYALNRDRIEKTLKAVHKFLLGS